MDKRSFMNESHVKAAEQAIDYMKKHLDEEVTSEQLAAHVGYSPYHFSRIFKQVTGISPRQYLAALRMESGKSVLLREPSLLMKILLSIGFRSAGSFHTRFKQYVGLSPKKFQTTSSSLVQHMNQYEHLKLAFDELIHSRLPIIHCRIEAPLSFNGIIFVGLFPRPIPDQKPIVGTAINLRERTCQLRNIPTGTYYVLAAGIPWSLNPKDYFTLDKSLRGIYESALQVDDATEFQISITLREPLPTDPPIVVNLPLLLFEKSSRKRAN
ncbi:AraC family transcriptional regulator [Paenibacillus marinisediminis]